MRETIQRYEASRYSGMIHNDNGPWVRYSDYIERIAKAEARNKVLEEAAKSALSALAWLPEDKGPVRQRVQQVIAELRAALREDR